MPKKKLPQSDDDDDFVVFEKPTTRRQLRSREAQKKEICITLTDSDSEDGQDKIVVLLFP